MTHRNERNVHVMCIVKVIMVRTIEFDNESILYRGTKIAKETIWHTEMK